MKEWEIRVLEIEQKAIAKFGLKQYLTMLSVLSGRKVSTIDRFFDRGLVPSLSIYCDLLEIVDTAN